MVTLGYFLSCEEHTPDALVEQARLAEDAGFDALWISDHFHPWNDEQGQSPFVWSVIGAIAQATSLPVTTAVTCPIMRMGPVITAQAAATSAVLLDGRFRLGVGTGEALNEHVLGDHWPPAPRRLEMLEESVGLMRELWQGGVVDHHGRWFTAENARLYTLPEQPPEVWVSAFGPKAAEVAARIGDGLVTTSVDEEVLDTFRSAGGKRTSVGFKVCWADTEDEGVATAHRLWANAGLPGELAQVLPTPQHFEQASQLVTRDSTREALTCGPDTGRHTATYDQYLAAGFDEIYVGNIGPDYRPMLEAYGEHVLPALRGSG
ncbi:TIGR03557 family F420-dependent LLM class oxidoreductase [Nocardioides sp. SYSU DS0651]|uniref:TIGR03557 family F420-dependent LLM class oxidoreductase n=1 Tax=Nocardioides sp. SYSU DS0651 TaxID=3415955 RepID=UPI003F4B5E31